MEEKTCENCKYFLEEWMMCVRHGNHVQNDDECQEHEKVNWQRVQELRLGEIDLTKIF